MNRLRLFLVTLALPALVGCDDRYEKRMLVTETSAESQEVVAAVSDFARSQGIACEKRQETLLSCYQQPTYVFVLQAKNGTEVCYSALTAHRKFARSHDKASNSLREALERQFGTTSVVMSVPSYAKAECDPWK